MTGIEKCEKSIKDLKINGIVNLDKSKIESLLLQYNVLNEIKNELGTAQQNQLTNKAEIEKITFCLGDCQKRIKELEKLKYTKNENEVELRSCLPEKLRNFAGREKEIEDVVKSIQKEDISVASVSGGPGFGKSALAVEVSHRLCTDHKMVVIYCDVSTAYTIEDLNLQICRDIGINAEDDPESSLCLWLKKLEKEMVFLLDDVDNLLEKSRSEFDRFIRWLRKTSNQKLKIITTSRTSFIIEDLSFQEHIIEEMKEESSMALLRLLCSNDQNDEFLQSLAENCGYVPLAMRIAASQVQSCDNPQEYLEKLKVQPTTVLRDHKSNRFVHRAFNTSYESLNNVQQNALLCLTIFEGDFDVNGAKEVLSGDETLLTDLVNKSMLKKSGNNRYSIHRLIRCFLIDQLASETERAKAEKLMVGYYLDLCANATTQSYACDKFMECREILKREAHNIDNVLKTCSKAENDPEILNILSNSELYTSSISCRFFYNIVKTIISGATLANFLQTCANVAKKKEDLSNRIYFDCILIDQEGRNSLWKSHTYSQKMKDTEEDFKMYKDRSTIHPAVQAHFFYQLGRYTLNVYKSIVNNDDIGRLDTLRSEANQHLCKSLELRDSFSATPLGNADVVLSLIQLGNLCKKNSSVQRGQGAQEDCEKSLKDAEEYYKKAMERAERNLGKHQLTCCCHKVLGDLYLQSRQNEKAIQCYKDARNMREALNLNTSEEYVLLLNNTGKCLLYLKRYNDAIKVLEEARDIGEKLVEQQRTAWKAKLYTSLALTYYELKNVAKAKDFAKKALGMNEHMNYILNREVKKLQNILDRLPKLDYNLLMEMLWVAFLFFVAFYYIARFCLLVYTIFS